MRSHAARDRFGLDSKARATNMSAATCKGASNAARQPKALSPSRVAPLFHVSGVARRLQTAAGYVHSSRLGKTKKIGSNAAWLGISTGS